MTPPPNDREAEHSHCWVSSSFGKTQQDNLVACCWLCNQAKGDTPVINIEDARKLIRQRRQAVLAHMVKELCRVGESFPRYQHAQVVRTPTVIVDLAAGCSNMPMPDVETAEG